MKQFLAVNVTASYGEQSIESTQLVTAKTLHEAANQIYNAAIASEENDEEFIDLKLTPDANVMSVATGEESYTQIISDDSPWFEKLQRYEEWSEEEYSEWAAFDDELVEGIVYDEDDEEDEERKGCVEEAEELERWKCCGDDGDD